MTEVEFLAVVYRDSVEGLRRKIDQIILEKVMEMLNASKEAEIPILPRGQNPGSDH